MDVCGAKAGASMRIKVTESQHDFIEQAAHRIVTIIKATLEFNPRFSIALSGGSTPAPIYEELATTYRDRVNWQQVDFFIVDERTVPPEHADSNFGMIYNTLLRHIPIKPTQIFRFQGEIAAEEAAHVYESQLHKYFKDSTPGFDLTLLGMGDDGHTASLFPHTEALHETHRRAVVNVVPQLDTTRLTLTAPFINQSANITFLVSGENKANALMNVLEGPPKPEQYPAQLIKPVQGDLLWLVDEAAASQLTHADDD